MQFAKGPYWADRGDFATAGSASINYTNALTQPIVRVAGGGQGFARAIAAASHAIGRSTWLGAIELQHNDGPWEQPDGYRKLNGVVRVSRGDALNGFAATLMGYSGVWNATDQVPGRAVESGAVGRFGTIDASDGGEAQRYSGSLEWQQSSGSASTKVSAFAVASNLNLFSNFTFFLDNPLDGDQFRQSDRRLVTGASSATGGSAAGSIARSRSSLACRSGTTTSPTSASTAPSGALRSAPSARMRSCRPI